jgi:hypothetical protein
MRVQILTVITIVLTIAIALPAAAQSSKNVIREVPFVCNQGGAGSVSSHFVNSNGKLELSIRSTAGSTEAQSAGMLLDGATIPIPNSNELLTVIFKVQGDPNFFSNAGLVLTLGNGFRFFMRFGTMPVTGDDHGMLQVIFTNLNINGATDLAVVGFGGASYSGQVSEVVVNPYLTPPARITKALKVVSACPYSM